MIRVSRVLHGTTAEGPGSRTAVWVQGCTIRCAGCINPQLFSFEGGKLLEPSEIIDGAISAGDEGITLLGGEPFDQAAGVAELAEMAQLSGLGVVTFTGYRLANLRQTGGDATSLLAHTDMLVDGPYVAGLPERARALVGSSNQQFIHLTERYGRYEPARVSNRVEIRVMDDGEIEVAGYLESDRLAELAQLAGARRRLAVRGR